MASEWMHANEPPAAAPDTAKEFRDRAFRSPADGLLGVLGSLGGRLGAFGRQEPPSNTASGSAPQATLRLAVAALVLVLSGCNANQAVNLSSHRAPGAAAGSYFRTPIPTVPSATHRTTRSAAKSRFCSLTRRGQFS
jgi:hypothetical protein